MEFPGLRKEETREMEALADTKAVSGDPGLETEDLILSPFQARAGGKTLILRRDLQMRSSQAVRSM